MPTHNYTDGFWEKTRTTNGNHLGDGEVLYWMPHPKKPEIIKNEP